MTQEQYNNWKDFTLRMTATVYPNATEARRAKIRERISDYFGECELHEYWASIEGWDQYNDNLGGSLSCDMDEFFHDILHWRSEKPDHTGKLFNQITCCIRSGFDMAVEQSGGVLGFDIGDVRRMYDGNVPEWVSPDDFEHLPDDTQVWL